MATEAPIHLGIILDGNRRWARAKGLPTLEGHRRGYENLIKIGEAALDRGVQYLSAYVFSTENWKRSGEEVDYLLGKLFWLAMGEIDRLHKRGVRVRFAGDRSRLQPKAIKAIKQAEAKTANNTRGTFVLCLNYGGQAEITEAVKAIVGKGIPPESITQATIAEHLYVPDVPPVDLIIRTSGEQRISNFMLWRAAYSEMLFVDCLWPDFDEAMLDECLSDYAARDRRIGK